MGKLMFRSEMVLRIVPSEFTPISTIQHNNDVRSTTYLSSFFTPIIIAIIQNIAIICPDNISGHFELDKLAKGTLRFGVVYNLEAELSQTDVAFHHVLVAEDGSQGAVAYSELGFALVALRRGETEGEIGSASSTVVTVVMGVVLLPFLAQLL